MLRCHKCSELLPADDGTGRCPFCQAYRPSPRPPKNSIWLPIATTLLGAGIGYAVREWQGFAVGAVAGWPFGMLVTVVRDEFR
jgi:hypothetical protein